MCTMIIFVSKKIVSSIIIESLLLLNFHVFGCFEDKLLYIIDFFFFLLSLTFKSERCRNLNFKSLFPFFFVFIKKGLLDVLLLQNKM